MTDAKPPSSMPAVREPEPEMGPALSAIPARWRKAALALFHTKGNQSEALRLAGYNGKPANVRISASRMFADERMRAAVREIAVSQIELSEPAALAVTLEIMHDQGGLARDRLTAARMLWDRSRPVETRTKIDVSHVLTSEETEMQHYRALQRIGAPQKAFTDRFGVNGVARVAAMIAADDAKAKKIEAGVTIDADFEEVSNEEEG